MGGSDLKRVLTLACLAAAVTAQAIAASPAGANTGALSLEGCVNSSGASNCGTAPDGSLTGLWDVAVSPDGKSVYTVANSTLTRFTADGQGRLSFQSCISSSLGSLCPKADTDVIRDASAVAVSPNGKSIYVTSRTYSSLALFSLDSDGDLTFDKCFSTADGDIFDECDDPSSSPLSGALDVAVNPSNGAVYVAAAGGVAEFTVGVGSALDYYQCFSADGSGGACGAVPSVRGGRRIAVSPDGREVFLTDIFNFTLTVFSEPTGHLHFARCINGPVSYFGCAPSLPPYLNSAIAVSPDSKSAYVGGNDTYSVARFAIGTASGTAGYDGCVHGVSGFSPCDTKVPALKYPVGIAVSPDGASLYVASVPEDGGVKESPDQNLSTFQIGRQGRLTYDGCIADAQPDDTCTGLPGRLMPPDPVVLSAVAVSPDSRSVYMTQEGSGALLHFYRQDGAVTTGIRSSDIDQQANSATFTFGTAGGGKRAGHAHARRFQCALKRGHRKLRFKTCRSPKVYRHLRPARYTFAVRQVDRAFKDRSPAKRRFKIN